MNKVNRVRCQACRYRKCIEAGMKPDAVKQDKVKKNDVNMEHERNVSENRRIKQIFEGLHNIKKPKTRHAFEVFLKDFIRSFDEFKILTASDVEQIVIQRTNALMVSSFVFFFYGFRMGLVTYDSLSKALI